MSDDIVYVLILLSSVALGFILRHYVTSPAYRQLFVTSVGVAMMTSVCGWNSLHALVVSVSNALVIRCVGPRKCHIVSCVLCFGYLSFFRSCHVIGLPAVDGHSNVVLLLMTLRLVGVAFEVHDNNNAQQQQQATVGGQPAVNNNITTSSHVTKNKMAAEPCFTDLISYSFCYIGLFTGPYYKYRTYSDMLHNADIYQQLNVLQFIQRRLQYTLPVCCLTLFIVGHYFSLQYAMSDAFYENESVLMQVFYMFPLFIMFRLRLCAAFVVAECACMSVGLGAYPVTSQPRTGHGPTTQYSFTSQQQQQQQQGSNDEQEQTEEYNFDTIHNIDVTMVELAPTMRQTIRAWNKTIQYWMAANIYQRLPFTSNPLKVTVTMLVSAYWHGLYPGYYLTFLSASFYLYVEQAIISRLNTTKHTSQQSKGSSPLTGSGWSRWTSWFCRSRACEYLGIGFIYRQLTDTVRYWKHLYFAGHIIIAVACTVCILHSMRRQRTKTA